MTSTIYLGHWTRWALVVAGDQLMRGDGPKTVATIRNLGATVRITYTDGTTEKVVHGRSPFKITEITN